MVRLAMKVRTNNYGDFKELSRQIELFGDGVKTNGEELLAI